MGYTISVPVTRETQDCTISALEEDVGWFEPPVSVLPVTEPVTGDTILEVKMKEEDVTIATFQGLRHKYPGMDVDRTGAHVDIIADKDTGMFMLMFVDRKLMKYSGTLAQFRPYCKVARNGPSSQRALSPRRYWSGSR